MATVSGSPINIAKVVLDGPRGDNADILSFETKLGGPSCGTGQTQFDFLKVTAQTSADFL
jgi:hypothetical protein